MPVWRCPVCGSVTSASGRCAGCRAALRARRKADEQRSAELVQEHRLTRGNVCPGWGRPPHRSDDLTASHRGSVADGAQGVFDGVLCRSCNSTRGRR